MGKNNRILSLDLLRGATIAAMILVNTPGSGDHVYGPLKHSEWNGCTPTDIIFPAFIFMAGVSIVFALGGKRSKREEHGKILLRAFRRMITLILLGWGISLVYRFDFAQLRFPGVLQRIGVVYFISVWLYLKMSERGLKIVTAAALLLYYLLFVLGPVERGLFDPEHNIAAYVDHAVFSAAHLYKWAYTDPCGLLGTLPAVGTALLGILAGSVLKERAAGSVRRLLLTGTGLIVAGVLAGLVFPINKPLWSGSYVLFTGGICYVLLALTYWYFDIKKGGAWAWPLLVFGTNAIVAYVVSETLPRLTNMINCTVHGTRARGLEIVYTALSGAMPLEMASLLSAIVFVGVVWVMMLYLYRKKIIVKI